MGRRRVVSIVVGTFIFLLLVFFSFFVIRPVYIVMSEKLTTLETTLMDFLGEKTGLSLSYRSLSPSIFSRLNIRSIVISEKESGREIAKIRGATLSYDIRKFINDDPLSAFDTLTVTGVEVEFDAAKDMEIVQKIIALFGENGEKTQKTNDGFRLDSILIPFAIVVRDISLHYSDLQNDAFVKLKKLSFSDDGEAGIPFSAEGSATFSTELLKDGKNRLVSAANFGISGTLSQELDGSSATVKLSEVSGADFSVNRLDMLLNYDDSKIQARTMRTAFPFSAFAEYDLNSGKINATLDAENFDPLALVSIKKKPEILQKIATSTISGNAQAQIDFAGGKFGGVSYDADLSVNLAPALLGERFFVAVNGKGDEKFVSLKNLSVLGKTLDASYSGTFDFLKIEPTGVAQLNRFTLPNGNVISGEVWAEPMKTGGIWLIVPVAFLGEKPLGAEAFLYLKKDSLDFSVELSDYAHAEDYSKATINVDGSLIFGEKPFVQARAEVDSLFADSALETSAFFLPQEQSEQLLSLAKTLSPYVLSHLEVYGSSDFKTFFAANTSRPESEFGVFALDGSNEMLNLSSLSVQAFGVSVQASASLDFSNGFNDISFLTETIVNSIPYNFSGNITPQWISVTGDYGFDAMIGFSDEISGFLQFNALPVSVADYIFSLSTMLAFSYSEENGFNANVARFEFSEPTGKIKIEPTVAFSGELSKYGFVFDAFSYSDVNSELDMSGNLSWSFDFEKSVLDFARIELAGRSPISTEGLSIQAQIVNPTGLSFSEANPLDDYYISAEISVDSFPFSRFLDGQGADNILDAKISASGTILDPFVSVDISRASLILSGLPLETHGRAVLNDTGISVEDFNISWAFLNVKDFFATFDPVTFSGTASAQADFEAAGRTLSAPLEFSASGVVDEDAKKFTLPDFYSVSVSSKGLSGSLLKNAFPFKLNLVHIPGQFDIFSDNPHGFKASIDEAGAFSATTGKSDVLSFNAEGFFGEGGAIDIFITSIEADLSKITSEFDVPFVSFPSGNLLGNVRISGLTNAPEIAGALQIDSLSLLIPMLSKSTISADSVQITAGAEGINMSDTPFSIGNGSVMVSSDITLDRWEVANIFLSLRSIGKLGVPIDLELPMIHIAGEARADLDISVILPDDIVVQGSVSAENTDIEITANELQEKLSLEGIIKSIPLDFLFGGKNDDEEVAETVQGEQPIFNIVTSLDLNVGNQVRIACNPFLRALIAPGTSLGFTMDSATGEFGVVGEVSLHGGEVSWLNRNFYLREGRIVFNETQDNIDPLVTVRAETREQDEEGNRVTITLSAQSQPVSRFNPTFSASPAKSEFEIMTLLGQVISADAEGVSDIALAGGDYLVQATVVRRLENALRELLNFDIFSLRTNVLQNAVKAGLGQNGNSNKKTNEEKKNDITFSNFFDNSTVYVGKYFGSSIYVDAMFHWTYDETKLDDGTTVNGMVFQPEFGFEMSSPFVNIRLGVAPDVESIKQNLWVQSSSITLSWKHQF